MLSDFWPHGEVSKAYGAFLDDKGFATRASFVIDKDGVVRWAVVNGPGEARSADDYAAALAAL
jgi:alkyl hydroperoxide reductase subunit AhpC